MPVGGGQESVMLALQEFLELGTWRREPGGAVRQAATLNVMLARRRALEGWTETDLPTVATFGSGFTEGSAVQNTPSVEISHLGMGEELRNSHLYDHLLVVNVLVKPKDVGNDKDGVILAAMRIADEIASMCRRRDKERTIDGDTYLDGEGNRLNNGGTGSAQGRILNTFAGRGGPIEPRRRPRSESGKEATHFPSIFYSVPITVTSELEYLT